MFRFINTFFSGKEDINEDSDSSGSQSEELQTVVTSSVDDAPKEMKEPSAIVLVEVDQAAVGFDLTASKKEAPSRKLREIIESKKETGRRGPKRQKQSHYGKIVTKENVYYCREDDTIPLICESWPIVGGVDTLLRLNTPYGGSKVSKKTRFKAGTKLRINDLVPNPGAGQESKDNVQDGIKCSKCHQGHSPKGNPIMLCDGPNCSICLHTICAGITRMPKTFLCEPCADNKFVHEGIRPMACKGCGSSQAMDAWEKRAGLWFHVKCLGIRSLPNYRR